MLADAAKSFWVRKKRNRVVEWRDREPANAHRWERRIMIAGGLAYRRQKSAASDKSGLDIYKGENIVSCEVQGDPIDRNIDPKSVSDRSLWAYADILPEKGYAVAQISQFPNAAAFDPRKVGFLNTATLFFPQHDLEDFPFDLYMLSSPVRYAYVFAARMGIVRAQTSHVYPTNLRLLPWKKEVVAISSDIETLRPEVLRTCTASFQTRTAITTSLAELDLPNLKEALRADKGLRITWSASFEVPDHTVEVSLGKIEKTRTGYMLRLSSDLLDWVEVNDIELAKALQTALSLEAGAMLTKKAIMAQPIPMSSGQRERWDEVLAEYDTAALQSSFDTTLGELDRIVGSALGLDKDCIVLIRQELSTDPFLRRMKPRYPGTETRKLGLLKGLDSTDRYA